MFWFQLSVCGLFPALALWGQSDSLRLPPKPVVEEIFVIVPFKQVFPGCEHLRDYAEQRICADQKLEEFIYENLIYPEKAKRKKREGIATVRFYAEKNGTLSPAEVVNATWPDMGKEAVRLLWLMRQKGIEWTVCRSGGRSYRCLYELSVVFSLEDEDRAVTLSDGVFQNTLLLPPSPPPPPPPPPKTYPEPVISAIDIDEPPLFPGCDDLGRYSLKKECANKKIQEFIQGNLIYPPKAKRNNVEGVVLLSFVVERNGAVSNGKIIHEPGSGTGREALRLIELMNTKGLKFSPVRSEGRTPRVRYQLAVAFEL